MLAKSKFVDQIFVWGSPKYFDLVAVIVPNRLICQIWMQENNLEVELVNLEY